VATQAQLGGEFDLGRQQRVDGHVARGDQPPQPSFELRVKRAVATQAQERSQGVGVKAIRRHACSV
jgi:hypothetical protein